MSFQTLIIENNVKLCFKENYILIDNNNEVKKVFIPNINTVLINTTQATITTHLIKELINRNIKIIFCDERKNPCGEIQEYYGCHNSSEKIRQQVLWEKRMKEKVWTEIIQLKIKNQAELLLHLGIWKENLFVKYLKEMKEGDITNREGFAAKVYFHTLFGENFNREIPNNINAMLNYGYTILLSAVNRAISIQGYSTIMGIGHCSGFNNFNLSCDIMEPFRPVIDNVVYKNKEKSIDKDIKYQIIRVLSNKIRYNNKKYTIHKAIELYAKDVFESMNKNKIYTRELEIII